jgi:aryl-alcohol dehydrogenase-like predicted oxidoreductase
MAYVRAHDPPTAGRKPVSIVDSLIYGTGSLHRIATASHRQRAIGIALDAGFRAFDLAPSYGNGIDETEVGIALRGRRDEVALHTKYGIPIDIYGAGARHLFPLFRLADRFSGRTRRAYARRDFSPQELERSVNESLRRLRTDRVDILFLHEPIFALASGESDAILDRGARLKRAGKIGALGIAGPAASVLACPSLGGFDVLQTRCDELERVAQRVPRTPLIAYGVHAAFRATGAPDFSDFVRAILDARPGTRVILTSRRASTIGSFGSILS